MQGELLVVEFNVVVPFDVAHQLMDVPVKGIKGATDSVLLPYKLLS